jgi:DNA polymerase kappa
MAEDDDLSLKHRLLGPSLTKAGQDKVDQQKVAAIIFNASKGSKFFANEQVRDRALSEKIVRLLRRRDELMKTDLSHATRKADEYMASLELGRDLSQAIVHMDCDAFYAAVEELDRPDLKNVPFAVGKGVLTTCNYKARKFGCRSGMAGFVAKKLCPQLILLPINFDKYRSKAEEVRAVISKYDPRFESASIDEAYLNITSYCAEADMEPWDAVEQMRKEIFESCNITVSAGLAANAKLAKIASDRNKPNGQFRVAPDRQAILAFMKTLPVRKVNGVGRVFERELDAVGIKAVGDVHAERGLVLSLFGDKAYEFLLQTYLGLGRTKVSPAEEYERKSVGSERTFSELQGEEQLRKKLREIAEELERDLKRTEFKGRTLGLKAKLHTYEVLNRQTVPPYAVHKADDIEKFALPMLAKLEKEYPNMRLRLMGLRCTGLVSMQKVDVDFFGVKRKRGSDRVTDSEGWEVWPETEFEAAAKQEQEEQMEEMERFSQECDKPEDQFWECPVCMKPQPANDKALNEHVDECLSKKAIGQMVKEEKAPALPPVKKKRGRPKADAQKQVPLNTFFRS